MAEATKAKIAAGEATEDGNDESALSFARMLHAYMTLPVYLVCLCNGALATRPKMALNAT